MAFIFESCQDVVGSCVRQYFMFFLCLISLVLAAYSSYKTVKMEKHLTFELLPLLINTFTSLFMVIIFSQIENFNAELFLYIVEFYTYFVLCFGFVMIVLKQNQIMKDKIKVLIRVFIAVTILSMVAIVLVIVLRFSSETIGCTADQGIGKIVLISIELPIIIVTFYYVKKFKSLLNNQSSKYGDVDRTFMTKHLIQQEDRYVVLKQQQASLIQGAQVINFIMHLVELLLFYTVDKQQICNENDQLFVNNSLQLAILWIQSIVQIFPHFMIPIIFWYMPAKVNNQFQTVFISEASSHRESHQREPLPKLKIGDHQQSEFYQNMHNQENIRQKLAPGTSRPTIERTTSY